MTNTPFTRMAVSLSGGGYRATTFHLGALSLLDAIHLEPENGLITDENRRPDGATLLENVHILSTISGGTLTGIMYALKLSQKEKFKDCYYKLYDLLSKDELVEHALKKLNSPGNWKNKYKNRNLINSFAEVYNEEFYEEATFGDLYKDLDSHLTDVIFGASEFTAGLQYRFQESKTGLFGANNLVLPDSVSERIRLADSAASSSCFPGGFEPMTMPADFSNGPDTRVEEWWTKKKIDFEKEAVIAIEHAELAAAEAKQAAKQAPDLAASILTALETVAKTKLAAKKAKVKVTRTKKQALKAAASAKSETASENANIESRKKAKKAADARAVYEKTTASAQEAAEEAAKISAQAPKLAAILTTAQNTAQKAADAVAIAKKVAAKAENKVRKANQKAKEAAELAEKKLRSARETFNAAINSKDVVNALKSAEKIATESEETAKKASEAAVAASEAAADLALIASEKAVAATIFLRKRTKDAIKAEEKTAALLEVVAAALKANKAAIAAADFAEEAANASKKTAALEKSCTQAGQLAEYTSAQVATYWLDKADKPAHTKANKAAKVKDSEVVTEVVVTKEVAKENAITAALAVVPETTAAVAAAKEAAALKEKSPAITKALTAGLKAAEKAVTAAVKAEKASVFARKDEPHHPTTAIMDGGILDNQGIRGVVMAEKRHTRNGVKPPYIGTYIISDVSGKTMTPYSVPTFVHNSTKDLFTLKRINIAATILFFSIIGLLILRETPTWGVIIASSILTILGLWFSVFLYIRAIFRARVSETFAGDELPEIMQNLKILVNTPLYIIIHLLKFRASSALKMITDIFLRRIRELQIKGLFKNATWNYRIVINNIYDLKGADKLTLKLKRVIAAANNMPTTLWFTQKEKDAGVLDDLIACGQLTLCNNLANYIRKLKKDSSKQNGWKNLEHHHQEIDALLTTLETYWQKFRVDPHWLIKQYHTERKQHEGQKRDQLSTRVDL